MSKTIILAIGLLLCGCASSKSGGEGALPIETRLEAPPTADRGPESSESIATPAEPVAMTSERAFSPPRRISVPSDPSAQYFVVAVGGSSTRPTITTMRKNRYGEVSYSMREYDCTTFTWKYLRDGDSWEQMLASRPTGKMSMVIRESIAYYVGLFACNCTDHPGAR